MVVAGCGGQVEPNDRSHYKLSLKREEINLAEYLCLFHSCTTIFIHEDYDSDKEIISHSVTTKKMLSPSTKQG